MYGSIRKSYGAQKASRDTEKKERKVPFAKKSKSVDNEEQQTSYINVENNSKGNSDKRINEPKKNENNNFAAKNEFPIASVILTIVFTMMIMVLAFGFGG